MTNVIGDTALSPIGARAGLGPGISDSLDLEVAIDVDRGIERWSVLRRMLASADLLAALVAGMVAGLLSGVSMTSLVAFPGIVGVGWPAVCFVCGLYSAEDLRSWASGVGEAPRMVFAALSLSWPLLAAAGALGIPWPVLAALLASAGAGGLAAATRGLARAYAHQSEPLRQRTVIVGSGIVAGQVVEKLRNHSEFGLEPIGVVDDDVHYHGHPDLPTIGRLDELSEVLDSRTVDRVIIAFSRASHDQLLHIIRACRDRRIAVDVVPRLFEFLDGARVLDQIGGMPLLSIGAHQLNRSSRAAKRALDILVSGTALLMLAPLLTLIAVAIKLDSRGPVLFRQPRPGRHGKSFAVLKFRSMRTGSESREELSDGVIVKDGNDPRVTRVGEIVRRFSLDELPQLLNVLKGDMSLVGPRPLVMSEIRALGEGWHERRLDLRPGMTGLWQVSGRSSTTFYERLRLDYQYVAGWSLARDIEILLVTLPAVVSGRGAY